MNDIILGSSSQATKLYGISVDTIFTTFITIFIFILGYIINKLINYFNERKKLKELKQYYLVLLKGLIKPIDTYITLIEGLADQIAQRKLSNIYFKGEKGFYLTHISKINQQDVFNSFIKRNRKLKKNERFEYFKNIVDNIEYLKTITVSLKENFNKFYESYSEFQDLWNENIEYIGRKFDFYVCLLKSNNMKPQNDIFFHEMDQITYKWSQLNNYNDMFVAIDNYIKPLKELTKRSLSDPRSMELLPALMKCSVAFTNMVNLKKYYSNYYNEMASDLKICKSSIEESVHYFTK